MYVPRTCNSSFFFCLFSWDGVALRMKLSVICIIGLWARVHKLRWMIETQWCLNPPTKWNYICITFVIWFPLHTWILVLSVLNISIQFVPNMLYWHGHSRHGYMVKQYHLRCYFEPNLLKTDQIMLQFLVVLVIHRAREAKGKKLNRIALS